MNQSITNGRPAPAVNSTQPSETSGKIGKGQPSAFIQKLYRMVDSCDPEIASWTPDGTMFVVKDPQVFERKVIPKYFAHNKYSSFSRQLNFYCFNKIHFKPLQHADFDPEADKQVTYQHKNFQRGRTDLLVHIKRPSKKASAEEQDCRQEIQILKDRVEALEAIVSTMFAERNAVKSLMALPTQCSQRTVSREDFQAVPGAAISENLDSIPAHYEQPRRPPPLSPLQQDRRSGEMKYDNIGNMIRSLPFV